MSSKVLVISDEKQYVWKKYFQNKSTHSAKLFLQQIARFNNNTRHLSSERKRSFFALSIVELYILHIFLAAGVTSIFFIFVIRFVSSILHQFILLLLWSVPKPSFTIKTIHSILLYLPFFKNPSFIPSSFPLILSVSFTHEKKTHTHTCLTLFHALVHRSFSVTPSPNYPLPSENLLLPLSLFPSFFLLFCFIFKYPRRFPLNLILRFSTLHRMLPSRVNFNITFSWKQTGPIYPWNNGIFSRVKTRIDRWFNYFSRREAFTRFARESRR